VCVCVCLFVYVSVFECVYIAPFLCILFLLCYYFSFLIIFFTLHRWEGLISKHFTVKSTLFGACTILNHYYFKTSQSNSDFAFAYICLPFLPKHNTLYSRQKVHLFSTFLQYYLSALSQTRCMFFNILFCTGIFRFTLSFRLVLWSNYNDFSYH
jgi:hypothetical protein